MSSGVAWWAGYLVSLAAFVVLGLRDPDTARRSAVWSMTATFAGMAVLATLRTLTIGQWLTPGPGFAAWFTVSALLATRGRPTRLAVGTPLDPLLTTSLTEDEERRARSARHQTLWLFFSGSALAITAWFALLRG